MAAGLLLLLLLLQRVLASPEVCTNALLPGAKGDQGEVGEVGDEGRLGKNGPTGAPGAAGQMGPRGDMGHTGKMGPSGDQGEKGDTGVEGPSGLKGKPGSTCDCGRYRAVVGQLDVNTGKLRNAVKFVKSVILGLKETEQRYYLLVKEPKTHRDASVNCKLRGGTLAMPKSSSTNRLMADYVGEAGLSRVYVGVKAPSKEAVGTGGYVYADSSPLQGFAAWSQEAELNSTAPAGADAGCVALLSTGAWCRVECESAMFFMCEFPKSRRGRGQAS
ncbi:collectin-10 [Betta splendens]|uniref:Collectin-10 n=1 Tax=Betta splendens TaxID=158456 RepID=A0A6P7KRS0_BETSP|nr:collectin-10 [Betta splendens]